jgi:hypothetical protein
VSSKYDSFSRVIKNSPDGETKQKKKKTTTITKIMKIQTCEKKNISIE